MSPSQGGQCGNGSTVALLSCFNLTKFDTFIPPHSFFEGSGLSEFENHNLSVFLNSEGCQLSLQLILFKNKLSLLY